MLQIKNHPIPGSNYRPTPIDVFYKETGQKKPVIVFSHGFKGFKDWGSFNLMAEYFAERGFVFVKFNFSHNGGTVENPIDFPDLEAFGNNTYTKELDDLGIVIDFIENNDIIKPPEIDTNKIYLLGHSRGGGISILKTNEDPRVKKLATLASVSNYGSRFPKGDRLKAWEEIGVEYVMNSRTKQQMPMNFELYRDFKANESRLDILKAANRLSVPFLILHGEKDPTVSIKDANQLHSRCKHSEMKIHPTADHTFNVSHPWTSNKPSQELQWALDQLIDFYNS